ncbi:hypothetical protein GCM10010910_30100 [Microbacterium nanhaiense]|uniref:Uncharacterized protein n=1 Tax=Microbacterium nanhaiense TaxID=1301026 RepID=A0ABQ2N581_9MICO|nr:hypothetical protein GCM10010910_30100 [Microbacterium nanhaiense]
MNRTGLAIHIKVVNRAVSLQPGAEASRLFPESLGGEVVRVRVAMIVARKIVFVGVCRVLFMCHEGDVSPMVKRSVTI